MRILLLSLLSLAACKTVQRPSEAAYVHYRVDPSDPRDSALLRLTAPYRDSVDRSMSDVVGRAASALTKEGANGSLGLFMTDAMLEMGKAKVDPRAQVAFVNTGGIRITEMGTGPITRGKVFELMPFDNILVVQEVPGARLQAFLDALAARGGWPVSGLTMEVRDRKAANVRIGGQPLDPARTYFVINSDYVINSAEEGEALRSLPAVNTGYLVRDALIDYLRGQQASGKVITPATEKRVF